MTKPRNGLTSIVVKRSIVIDKHKTSVSLENEVWSALKHIAGTEKKTLFNLAAEIDRARIKKGHTNLSSALRMHVVRWALEQADLLEVTTEMDHG